MGGKMAHWFILIACFVPHIIADTYYVTPSEKIPCPEKQMPCMTLTQYATQSGSYFSSNVSLILLPGEHRLEKNFSFVELATVDHVNITLNDNTSTTTAILCKNNSGFHFKAIEYIDFSRLTFVSCVRNQVQAISQFVIDNCTFTNTTSGGRLFLIEDSKALIRESYIIHNNVTQDCSVIKISGSDIVVMNSIISRNYVGSSLYIPCIDSPVYYNPHSTIWIEYSSFVSINSTYRAQDVQNLTPDSLLRLNYASLLTAFTSNVSVNSSNFEENNCTCVNMIKSNATIQGSTFTLNNDMLVSSNQKSRIEIESCVFSNNTVPLLLANLIDSSYELYVANSLFINNKAEYANCIAVADNDISWYTLSPTGLVVIQNTVFESNTFNNVVYISSNYNFTNAVIRNTSFHRNVITKLYSDSAILVLEARLLTATLEDVTFIQNNGDTLSSIDSTVCIYNTTFSDNKGSFVTSNSNVTFVTNTMFKSNRAGLSVGGQFHRGGALTCFQSDITFKEEATFDRNEAEYHGGAIMSTECRFDVVGDLNIVQNEAGLSGGGVFAIQSEINIRGRIANIGYNQAHEDGGGLYAVGTTIKLLGDYDILSVVSNSANRNGGGLYLDSNSRLYIIKNENSDTNSLVNRTWMYFSNNSADVGGDIYVNDETYSAVCGRKPSNKRAAQTVNTATCFLQILTTQSLNAIPSAYVCNSQNVLFTKSRARTKANNLYGGLLDRCMVSPYAEVFQVCNLTYSSGQSYLHTISNINYTDVNAVTSNAVRVCFCNSNNEPDCNYHPNIKTLKGRNFTVKAVAVDQIQTPVSNTVQNYLSSNDSINVGLFRQATSTSCTDLVFNILSPRDLEEVNLYADGACKDTGISRQSFKVTFLPCSCPVGFQKLPVIMNCSCECDPRLRMVLNCSDKSETVQRKGLSDSWFMHTNDTGFITYNHCPFDYCIPPSENSLHNIDFNQTDSLCASQRNGKLCGSCDNGSSLALGSLQCKPCSNLWLFLLMAFALGGIALVVFLLVFNLTTAVGTINGLIFYANIVAASPSTFFPYTFQKPIFLSVFISWLNLDLGIETCFFDGMDAYMYTWLQLAFPLYIIVLVIAVIVLSKYSERFTRLLSSRNPVATLATLISLSYAKLLRVVIDICLSAQLQHIDEGTLETVWLLDGNVRYLKGKHLYLFIAALIIMFLVIVYTLLLFSWQFFVFLPKWRIFKWTESMNLKFFVEAHHAPFNPKHRYWFGVLLISRIVLYTIMAFNIRDDFRSNLLAIILMVVCLLVLVRGVYNSTFIEVLEIAFFVNLIVFAVTTSYVRDSEANQTVVGYISTGIAFLLFCGILVYHTGAFILKKGSCLGERGGRVMGRAVQIWNTMDPERVRQPGRYTRIREPLDLVLPQADDEEYRQAAISVSDQQLGTADASPPNTVTYTVIEGKPN